MIKIFFKNNRSGFTLIELLVVVAIIGLLASVVLASVNTAREKAKDASIKEEVSQLVTLLNLNYNDYGDYSNLESSEWVNVTKTCNNLTVSGTYAPSFKTICNNIWNNAADIITTDGGYRFIAGTIYSQTSYSIMATLNDGKLFCSGSSGIKGEYSWNFYSPGCYYNP